MGTFGRHSVFWTFRFWFFRAAEHALGSKICLQKGPGQDLFQNGRLQKASEGASTCGPAAGQLPKICLQGSRLGFAGGPKQPITASSRPELHTRRTAHNGFQPPRTAHQPKTAQNPNTQSRPERPKTVYTATPNDPQSRRRFTATQKASEQPKIAFRQLSRDAPNPGPRLPEVHDVASAATTPTTGSAKVVKN